MTRALRDNFILSQWTATSTTGQHGRRAQFRVAAVSNFAIGIVPIQNPRMVVETAL